MLPTFPRLAVIARRILSVQATSTAAERMFSAGGLVASQQCAALAPANLDVITLLNKNREQLFAPTSVSTSTSAKIKQEPQDDTAASERTDVEDLPQLPFVQEWEDL